MNITITAENASGLDSHTPVTGTWTIDGRDDGDTALDVEESVKNWADASYLIEVHVFHSDGRLVTGDLPSSGTFVATRL